MKVAAPIQRKDWGNSQLCMWYSLEVKNNIFTNRLTFPTEADDWSKGINRLYYYVFVTQQQQQYQQGQQQQQKQNTLTLKQQATSHGSG